MVKGGVFKVFCWAGYNLFLFLIKSQETISKLAQRKTHPPSSLMLLCAPPASAFEQTKETGLTVNGEKVFEVAPEVLFQLLLFNNLFIAHAFPCSVFRSHNSPS